MQTHDAEPEPVANNQNKVRAVLTKKMCWERDLDDEESFYEDCAYRVGPSCLYEDRIEICYSDDIDAAQVRKVEPEMAHGGIHLSEMAW